MGNGALTTFSNMLTNLNLTDMETCYKVFRGDLARVAAASRATASASSPRSPPSSPGRTRASTRCRSRYCGRTYAEGKKIGWRDGVARALAHPPVQPDPPLTTRAVPRDPPAPRPACVYLMTRTASPEVLAEYQRLAEDLPAGWAARILFDLSSPSPPPPPREAPGGIVLFDSRRFAEWGFATCGSTFIPGHALFPLMRASRDEPGFADYWLVEHDVRFTGPWRLFFDACSSIDADLLTGHVREHADEPYWPHWRMAHPVESMPLERRVRALHTVARLSARALDHLRAAQAGGWSGHHEVLVPTLLRAAGLRIADYGGDGPFVPAGFRNRFYTSYSTLGGELRAIGTVRYRPARSHAGRRKNTLYHPVKSAAERALAPAGPRTSAAWELVRHLNWRLRRRLAPARAR